MAESTIKYPVHYPIGVTICTSTNTNPSSIYGGTWSLYDKEFARKTLSGSDNVFTIGSGASSYSGFYVVLSDHDIFIRISITTNTALTDSNVTLGTFDLSKMGLSTSDGYVCYVTGFGGDGITMSKINGAGEFTSSDVFTRSSNGTIASGSEVKYCIHYLCAKTTMIDSFCDKFYWRRTA